MKLYHSIVYSLVFIVSTAPLFPSPEYPGRSPGMNGREGRQPAPDRMGELAGRPTRTYNRHPGDPGIAEWKKLHERAEAAIDPQAILQRVQDHAATDDDLYIAGLTAMKMYRNDEAEDIFRQILKRNPVMIEAQWGIAECLRRKRQYDRSIGLLEDLITKNPQFAPAYISLAYIRYIQTDFAETARLAFHVLRLGKEEADIATIVQAYSLYAGTKGMLAHFGGPISKIMHGRAVLGYLKKAESLQPSALPVLFGMGSYYLLVPKAFGRDLDQAERYLLAARDADPHFTDTYVRLAQVYKLKGDSRLYRDTLEKALTLDPEHEIALDVKNGRCKFICPE